ncbi:hypothetical protein PTKIN_Ptkin03bG0093300 [Pterospermum kingtungense]
MLMKLELTVLQSFKTVLAITPTLSKITTTMLLTVIPKETVKLKEAVISLALLLLVLILIQMLLLLTAIPQGMVIRINFTSENVS